MHYVSDRIVRYRDIGGSLDEMVKSLPMIQQRVKLLMVVVRMVVKVRKALSAVTGSINHMVPQR
jgi:hypothetical protein